jgi:DNA-binding SARP family transcriptional activator
MQIRLFGNLRISVAESPVTSVNTNRLQSLIAYLILHCDTPQPRERLAFTLWPGSRESQARTNLRQLLHNLKRALPEECNSLLMDHFTVQWRQDASCTVDALDFQSAIAEAAAARAENNREKELQALTTAAQLYEDDLCLRFTKTGSHPCAKSTEAGFVMRCTGLQRFGRNRDSTQRRSRGPSGLSRWIRCPKRITSC